MTQIFGYTPAHLGDEPYVRFAQAHAIDGGVRLDVRDGAGDINSVVIPYDKARELAAALVAICDAKEDKS